MSSAALLGPRSAGHSLSPPPYHNAFNGPPLYSSSSKGSRYSSSNDFVSPLAQIGKKQQRKSLARSYSSDNAFVSPLSKISYTPKASRSKTAKRSKKATPSDVIDLLDESSIGTGHFHHEGPFDATLASRQVPGRAPVDALRYSNGQALAATPRANIIDSLTRKVPLQGTGMVPPGMVGPGGQRFEYYEDNVNQLEGKLGRYADVNYRDEDLKGKGEPCYSYEESEKSLGNMKYPNSATRRRAASDVAYYPYNMNESSKAGSSSTGLFRSLRNKLHLRNKF